jgi:hypothetical protein
MEQLIEPGSKGQYFLRKPYKDPLVKDGEWGLLFLAPGGGIYDPNGEEGGLDANGNPIMANPAAGGSPFGGATQGGFGSNSSGGSALQRMGQDTGRRSEDAFGRGKGRSGPSSGGFEGAEGRRGSAFGNSAFGNSAGQSGESGLPIAGVKSLCEDKPFRVFRDQEDYSKWLFAFNDQDMQPPPLPGQGPAVPPQFPGQRPGAFPGQLTRPGGAGGQPGGASGQPGGTLGGTKPPGQ